jgi:hypothetical protein
MQNKVASALGMLGNVKMDRASQPIFSIPIFKTKTC